MNWWFVLSLSLLASCRTFPPRPDTELVRRSQPLFGTFVTISVYTSDRTRANAAINTAFDEFRRVDALMSIHRADSELSQLNARASFQSVAVSPDLFRVIAKSQEISHETDGAFDVTIRPLADLWGFTWKEYRMPTEGELKAVLPHVDYRLVELDTDRRTVRFKSSGVSIDLGGIAKGFAVDCAIEKLHFLGVTNATVKAGGDLRVIGAPPGKPHWAVQLEDPRKEGRRFTLPLRDAALSTTGNYENFFEVHGKRYGHILNPRTGLPVQGVAACSVIAPTCMESDAWATALFVYGVERNLAELGNRYPARLTLALERSGNRRWEVRQSPTFPKSLRTTTDAAKPKP